jgi:predicted TIM-barrel fold metal-dependent hydrolase
MTVEYIKDAPPRIFDVHCHYPWRNNPIPPSQQADFLAYSAGRLNIRKLCLLGRPGDDTWEQTLDAARRYPDLYVPVAHIRPDEEDAEAIEALFKRGFRGLKITTPARDYDDEAYFPIYEQAEKLGMPILFHTGIRGGPVDYLQFHPGDMDLAARISREGEQMHRGSRRGAARMQPILLDTIGIAFPELHIIGAHLGYGFYDSACAVARWRRNVSFDVSGGKVVRRHIVERKMIGLEILPEKLVFGTDCDVTHLSREVTGWMDAFEEIGLAPADQDRIFYRNAAAIFGIDD